MENEPPASDSELQRQVDELSERMAVTRSDIEALQARAEATEARAHVTESRAHATEARADATEAHAEESNRRMERLEARADIDRRVIAELQADGMLSQEHVEHLEEALRSSRTIGAAIGIIMAHRRLTQTDAFAILAKASQNTNRKLHVLADEVVHTGDVSDLPSE